MAEILLRGKRLGELKVTELKEELDKRGQSKKGVKTVLVDRLRKAILQEELTAVAQSAVDSDDEGTELDNSQSASEVEATEMDHDAAAASAELLSPPPASPPTVPLASLPVSLGSPPSAPLTSPPATPIHPSSDEGAVPAKETGSAPKGRRKIRIRRRSVKKEVKTPVATVPQDPPTSDQPEVQLAAPEEASEGVIAQTTETETVVSATVATPEPNAAAEKTDTEGEIALDIDLPFEDGNVGAESSSVATKGPTEQDDSRQASLPRDADGGEKTEESEGQAKCDDGEFEGVEMELVPEEEVLAVDHEGTPVLDETLAGAMEPMELATPLEADIETCFPGPEEQLNEANEGGPAEMALEEEEEVVEEEEGFHLELDTRGAKVDEDDLGSSFSSDPKFEEPDDDLEEDLREEEDEEASADRARLNSHIDPSYHPESDELLYEGDVEIDPAPEDREGAEPDEEAEPDSEAFLLEESKEEGYVVRIHDDSMDIDEGASKSHEPEKKKPPTEKPSSPPVGDARSADETVRPSQCLWVSGLVLSVKATDLQTLFSPFGQVVSAKVMAKSRARGSSRFGFVTMATTEQTQRCISELNGTELKGHKISVEMARSQPPITPSVDDSAEKASPSSSASRKPREEKPAKAEAKGGDKNGRSSGDDKKEGRSSSHHRSPPSTTRRERDRGNDRGRRSFGQGGRPRDRARSPPALRRSPPLSARLPSRLGRRRSRSPIHSRFSGAQPHPHTHTHPPQGPFRRGDARHDIMRREFERRDLLDRRLGSPYNRDRERQVELRLEQRRLVHDRHHEMVLRRQLEMEHTRREADMARRMQESREREARERELREKQLAEQERVFRERERELRERELRERQRREQLERELREKEMREREAREKERRVKEQQERELREREIKMQRERELRERVQIEKERELRDKERRIQEEQIRIEKEHRAQEELRLHEEQERRTAARTAREEQERRERDRRQREERDRERERERQERDRERQERERRERELEGLKMKQSMRKRPFSGEGYESAAKKAAMHDVRGGSSPGIFSRLGPGQLQGEQHEGGGTYRRGDSKPYDTGMGMGGGSSYKSSGVPQGSSRERRGNDDIGYPIPTSLTAHGMHTGGSASLYAKSLSQGMAAVQRTRPPVMSAGASSITPDLISVAQALQSIQKAVAGTAQAQMPPIRVPQPSPSPLQQLAAAQRLPFLGLGQSGHLAAIQSAQAALPQGLADVRLGKPQAKLPPEDERYNRRLNRPSGDGGGGGGGGHLGRPSSGYMYKRGM